jgi:tetratricopeptide (TPR) repeat protein
MDAAFYCWIGLDWAATRAWVEPCVRAGIMGEMNRTMLADSLRAMGHMDDAVALYEQALATYPDNGAYIRQGMVDALARKAAALGLAGKGAAAAAVANRAFAADPSNPLAMLVKASALIYEGDPGGAAIQIDRAVASPRLAPGGRQSAEVMRKVISDQRSAPKRGAVFVVVNP